MKMISKWYTGNNFVRTGLGPGFALIKEHIAWDRLDSIHNMLHKYAICLHNPVQCIYNSNFRNKVAIRNY